MDIIKSLFWNGEERRLRLVWRFLVFLLVLAPALAAAQALLYFIAPTLLEALQKGEGPGFISGWALSEWLMLIALIVTLFIIGRWVDRRPFSDYGFRLGKRWWLDLAFGLGLGALLMTGIFVVESLLGWVQVTGTMQAPAGSTFAASILTAAGLFLAVGVFEELLSRGYLLHNLAEGLNFKFWTPAIALALAWLFSSSFFGLAHASNPNATAISIINLVLAGLFLGLGYVITGDLAIPIGLHIAWNFFEGNVFGFPVSGTPVNQVTFIAIQQRGPELWTGGAFGPEAGMIGNVAILIGAALILAWVKWRYGRVQLQASIPLPPSKKRADQQSQ